MVPKWNNPELLASKHWNRYQVNRVESVSGATGSALEKTRIDAMQYIKTRPNIRFKKYIGAQCHTELFDKY